MVLYLKLRLNPRYANPYRTVIVHVPLLLISSHILSSFASSLSNFLSRWYHIQPISVHRGHTIDAQSWRDRFISVLCMKAIKYDFVLKVTNKSPLCKP
jgi:hypothetical protein